MAHQQRHTIEPYLNGHRLPSRSTYFDRFKKVQTIVEEAIVLMGKKAIKHRWADASIAAVDKSLMIAKGPKWWKSDRIKSEFPKGFEASIVRANGDLAVITVGYKVIHLKSLFLAERKG